MDSDRACEAVRAYLMTELHALASHHVRSQKTASGWEVEAAVAVMIKGKPCLEFYSVRLSDDLSPVSSKRLRSVTLNLRQV